MAWQRRASSSTQPASFVVRSSSSTINSSRALQEIFQLLSVFLLQLNKITNKYLIVSLPPRGFLCLSMDHRDMYTTWLACLSVNRITSYPYISSIQIYARLRL